MNSPKSGDTSDLTRVAPTAWYVAYLRTYSDIPLAQELFQALEARLTAAGEESLSVEGANEKYIAPQLEARYKLVAKLLKQTGCTQILELAAGISTHGINLTRHNKDLQYVELDLPDVTAQKRAILKAASIPLPPNLTIVDGSALSKADVMQAVAQFDTSKPIAVMNEGLLRYLDFHQKATVARVVRSVLEKFGGYWVTPDSNLLAAIVREDEKSAGHTTRVNQQTGIRTEANAFKSLPESKDFYEKLGYDIQTHSFLEVTDELVSPGQLGMSDEEVHRLNEAPVAYVMKLKDKK